MVAYAVHPEHGVFSTCLQLQGLVANGASSRTDKKITQMESVNGLKGKQHEAAASPIVIGDTAAAVLLRPRGWSVLFCVNTCYGWSSHFGHGLAASVGPAVRPNLTAPDSVVSRYPPGSILGMKLCIDRIRASSG
jgi:hypothetical protein